MLEALSDGEAKTAGEVATVTGVARGTVATTLSKLAKSGEVVKADRGYRLPSPGTPAPAAATEPASTPAPAAATEPAGTPSSGPDAPRSDA